MDFNNKQRYISYPVAGFGLSGYAKRKVRKANQYKIYLHNKAVNKQQREAK